jgi:hypothetical protein
MGLDSNPVFLDQDTGNVTSRRWAPIQGVRPRGKVASIAVSPIRRPELVTVERPPATGNVARSVLARASVGAGVCILWLLIASTVDKARCEDIGAEVLVAPTEKARDAVEPHVMRDEFSVVSQPAETTVVEQKQTEALDQKRDRADELVRELASLAAGLEKARIAGLEAAHALESDIRQRQALEQEHSRADTLAREVSSLRAELDSARAASSAERATEADTGQKQALEQEQARADMLAGEVASLRAELDVQNAALKAAQAAAAEQKQVLEQELNQERDKTSVLTGELSSLREELEAAHAASLEAARSAEAATNEQQLAAGKERARTEALASELASARKVAEERSARLAAAHAEALQVMDINSAKLAEQNLALASERDRADALERELSSARNDIESGKKQIAGLHALLVAQAREPVGESARTRGADASAKRMEGKGRSPERLSSGAVVSTLRSSKAELSPAEARTRSTTGQAASDLSPKVATATERLTSTSDATRPREDEQRLLARASALLRLADISGARPLLELALEHGSARAAFMLAETYDTRVLQSWRARGISGDVAMARKLYERAQAGGIEDAKERIEALK